MDRLDSQHVYKLLDFITSPDGSFWLEQLKKRKDQVQEALNTQINKIETPDEYRDFEYHLQRKKGFIEGLNFVINELDEDVLKSELPENQTAI